MRSLYLVIASSSALAAGLAVAAPTPIVAAKAVATVGIERYLPPAGPASGLPPTIQGLWWADAPHKQFLLSFRTASWDTATRTAALRFAGAGVFGYPTTRTLGNGSAEFDQVDSEQAGYQAVFSADARHAELLLAKTAADGTRQAVDKGFSLDLSADGTWILHAPGSADLTLRRIVDAAGHREAAYADYQRTFGAAVEVYGSAAVLTPPQPLTLDLAAGDQVLVKVGALDPNAGRGNGPAGPAPIVLRADAQGPLQLDAYNDVMTPPVTSIDGRSVLLPVRTIDTDAFVAVSSVDGQAQHLTLRASPAPISTLDERQPLTIDLAAGEMRLVQTGPTAGHEGLYRSRITGTVPAPVYIGGDEAYKHPLSGAFVQSHGILDNFPTWGGQPMSSSFVVVGDAKQATTYTLTFTKEGGDATPRGKVVLDGASVSGKLAAIGDIDTFDLVVPAGFHDEQVTITMDNASLNRFAVVGFADPAEALTHIYGFANGTHVVGTDDWSKSVYVNPGALHLAIAYYGEFNAADVDLTYSFSVQTKRVSP